MPRYVKLPENLYTVRERYLQRVKHPESLEGTAGFCLPDIKEIWIERSKVRARHHLNDDEREYVRIHELVHARRIESNEEVGKEGDVRTQSLEELFVELETIARATDEVLEGLFHKEIVLAIKKFLTNGGEFDPDTLVGLTNTYQRIEALIALLKVKSVE